VGQGYVTGIFVILMQSLEAYTKEQCCAMLQDGRLRSGDRLLQIGEVDVRDLSTEEVASVLRQSGVYVGLIVSRSVDAMPDVADPVPPVIPIDQLDDYLMSINQAMDLSRLSSDADLSSSRQSLPV